MGDDHVSRDNSRKLDALLEKLDAMAEQCSRHEVSLYGEDGRLGIAQKMRVVWGLHVWVLMALSGALGSAITALLMTRITK